MSMQTHRDPSNVCPNCGEAYDDMAEVGEIPPIASPTMCYYRVGETVFGFRHDQ